MSLSKGYTDCFPDKRLNNRCGEVISNLFSKGVHSIRQLSDSLSQAKGFYRFLSNARVEEQSIISDISSRCGSSCKGKTVLCIQDSTEVNMYNHRNRLKSDGSLGTTNAKVGGLGFLLHPSLVVDAQTCIPYGFSDIKIWNRPEVRINKHDRNYSKLPIQEKESYKWIESSQKSKEALIEAESIIIVQDREGDIYEQFSCIPDEKTDLLVRASTNRTLLDKTKLFDAFDGHPAQGSYQIKVEGDKRKKRIARIANIEVRYKEVEIKRTGTSPKDSPDTVKLFYIEAKEKGLKDCNGPICWRLLTTIQIEDLSVALCCIEWYSWRWTIEEVFRILKKEGFNIEASELEYGQSIRKLSLLMLDVILKLFMMQLSYSIPEEEGLPADSCFSQQEQQCSEGLIKVLEGKTERQKNIYKKLSLKRHVWTIARLGGWKGYASERPPGITTLWIGLQKFSDINIGWKMKNHI